MVTQECQRDVSVDADDPTPYPVSRSRDLPGDETKNDKDCRYYYEDDVRCSYPVSLICVEIKARISDGRCLVGHGVGSVVAQQT